ncbi:MAG: biotin--[acetyl-CoA-carboxylase] ligase [Acidimicrobiales bacterium]
MSLPPAHPPDWEVRRFPTLASTNAYLLDEARTGAPAGVVAVAEYQSAGRGRMGRSWEAPPGTSLLVSVLLRPTAPPTGLFACSATVALSAADACGAVAGTVPGIKWPNDLVVADRKLAGVLAESDAAAPGGRPGSVAVVVGLGCNVDWRGPDLESGTSLAAEAGRAVDKEALLEAFLAALAPRVAALDGDDGRGATVDALRRRCVTLGRRVRVEQAAADASIEGEAVDLAPDGRLVVDVAGERMEVAAADVVHLRPAR